MKKLLTLIFTLLFLAPGAVQAQEDASNSYYKNPKLISNGSKFDFVADTPAGRAKIAIPAKDGTFGVGYNSQREVAIEISETSRHDGLGLHAMASSRRVEITWASEESNSQIVITRNGVKIAEVDDDGFFEDIDIKPGRDYTYQLIQMSGSTSLVNAAPLNVQGFSISTPDTSTLASANVTVSTLALAAPVDSTLRYQTFIRDSWVRMPLNWGCQPAALPANAVLWFAGNGRGFNLDSGGYKTRMEAKYNWASAGFSSTTRTVGVTIAYYSTSLLSPTKIYLDNKQASNSSMSIAITGLHTQSAVEFAMSQNIANPFCPLADGIQFSINVTMTKANTYAISGTFIPVPNHEIGLKASTQTSWANVLRAENQGFDCLVPVWNSICRTSFNLGG